MSPTYEDLSIRVAQTTTATEFWSDRAEITNLNTNLNKPKKIELRFLNVGRVKPVGRKTRSRMKISNLNQADLAVCFHEIALIS